MMPLEEGDQAKLVGWKRPLDPMEPSIMPDETAYDLLSTLGSSHSTGLKCIDDHLLGGWLGVEEPLVLQGPLASGKSIALRSILAKFIASTELGGYAVPAVHIDTDGSLKARCMMRLLQSCLEGPVNQLGGKMPPQVEESLSRLLVLRPREPLQLLQHLWWLRDVLTDNPKTAIITVDSMSSWQGMTGAFARSASPFLSECWSALMRLQREHRIAVVVVRRSSALGLATGQSDSGAP
eukprot:2420354-Amphidinium_carterae.1